MRRLTPVLKIKYHGYHGRGTKGIWGDQRDVYCFFVENIWETLLVLPESLFRPLKFSLWSSQNHCSVPSNSVYSPPQIIVLSPPNYKSLFPPKSLLCPLKFHLSCIKFRLQSTKNIFCPLLITNHWSPQKITVLSPLIPNHCSVLSSPFMITSKSLFCPLKFRLF